MCHSSIKTMDHLLILCSVSLELWSFAFRMFGIWWVLLKKVLDLLCEW